jgi:hypothetical protein
MSTKEDYYTQNKRDKTFYKIIDKQKKQNLNRHIKSNKPEDLVFYHYNLEEAEKKFGKYPEEVEGYIQSAIDRFGAYINSRNALIIFPETNLFFRLEDIKNAYDFQRKVLSWVSRSCFKTPITTNSCSWQNKRYHQIIRDWANKVIGHDFDAGQWGLIYCMYGNDCQENSCRKFMDALFDMSIPEELDKQQFINVGYAWDRDTIYKELKEEDN